MEHLNPREWKLRTAGVSEAIQDAHGGTYGSSIPVAIEDDPAELIPRLQDLTGLSPITLRVCLARGLATPEAIQSFLSPKIEDLTSPMRIRDMDRATERMSRARAAGETIRIFGDYDVDGTTGAALLSWVFRDFGFKHEARQPDRFKDGYGLNVGAVEEAAAAGAKVLITVDCGITSFDAAEKASALGIDLIVIDHHQIDAVRGLPKAHAVINPQRSDCESGLKQLCGCGLAFYFALGLRARGRAEGWWPAGQEPNLKQHLDLVVMATAADMVPLVGDNHILVRHGLDVLKSTKKPGVKALLDVAGIGAREISPGHLGFVIGPRINASGRMQSASLALELLTTQEASRGYRLAQELESLNAERANIQNQIWDEVRLRIEKGLAEGKYRHGIVVADASWHEGVVGIVASRVTETFRKPAAVIALREDFGKGSVRSFGGKDVLAALRASASSLKTFGGHRYAAGLSVELGKVDEFVDAFDHAIGELATDASALPLLIEGDCALEELDVKTLQELEKMGPFGPGNPEPVFAFKAKILNHQILKGRHLKLSLTPANPATTKAVEAIWFNAAERAQVMCEDLTAETEWAGVPELNRFRGYVKPTVRLKDWRKISRPSGRDQ